MFGATDDEIVRFTLPHLRRMFPDLGPECILATHVWRARYAQPLPLRDYGKRVPQHETPVRGLFLASMAQVYPEDRGTNYAIRDGRATARLAGECIPVGPPTRPLQALSALIYGRMPYAFPLGSLARDSCFSLTPGPLWSSSGMNSTPARFERRGSFQTVRAEPLIETPECLGELAALAELGRGTRL